MASRQYILVLKVVQPVCYLTKTEEASWWWHVRYGHLNFPALQKLSRESMVHGLPAIKGVYKLCNSCLIGKQRRSLFLTRSTYRATEPLELMHGDLCGPIKPMPPSDTSLFPLPVDDRSRFMWLVLLGAKSEATEAIKQVQARAEGKCDKRLRVLRTDQSGEFMSTSFQAYCNELGIQRHITAPYSPQQNGVVERRSQSVVGTA
jgi:hypothetical protein